LIVPISICKPLECTKDAKVTFDNIHFTPGEVKRAFVSVPEGATWGGNLACNTFYIQLTLFLKELVIQPVPSSKATCPSPRFMVHMIQLLPQERYTTLENKYSFTLPQLEDGKDGQNNGASPVFQKRKFHVVGGRTLEV
jgi:hypothetical protein